SGDEVEIIREPGRTPLPNWENVAVTGKARSAIRRAVRVSAQQRAMTLGEQVLAAVLEREAVTFEADDADQLAERFELPGRRDMLVAVGEGKISADDLARESTALKGKRRRNSALALPVGDNAEGWFSLKRGPTFKFRVPGGQRTGVQRFAALPRL